LRGLVVFCGHLRSLLNSNRHPVVERGRRGSTSGRKDFDGLLQLADTIVERKKKNRRGGWRYG
jgi:hypothetical protein